MNVTDETDRPRTIGESRFALDEILKQTSVVQSTTDNLPFFEGSMEVEDDAGTLNT